MLPPQKILRSRPRSSRSRPCIFERSLCRLCQRPVKRRRASPSGRGRETYSLLAPQKSLRSRPRSSRSRPCIFERSLCRLCQRRGKQQRESPSSRGRETCTMLWPPQKSLRSRPRSSRSRQRTFERFLCSHCRRPGNRRRASPSSRGRET